MIEHLSLLNRCQLVEGARATEVAAVTWSAAHSCHAVALGPRIVGSEEGVVALAVSGRSVGSTVLTERSRLDRGAATGMSDTLTKTRIVSHPLNPPVLESHKVWLLSREL